MSEFSDYVTLSTPDSQEQAAQQAKQIARGRWLTLFVALVALGGPLMELIYRYFEPYAEGSAVTDWILLIAMGVASYLLYKGHPWGKQGLIYFLGYMVISEGLGVLISFIQTMQFTSSSSPQEKLLVGLVMLLVSGMLMAVPIAALIVLWRSKNVARFLETRKHAS